MNMLLPDVLDASVALVAEGYQALGTDWWTALETAQEAGRRKVPETATGQTNQSAKPDQPAREKTEEEKVAENNAVLANIMGALGQSNFKGAKK